VVFNLCVALTNHCAETGLPYVPRMLKQVRLRPNASGREESRKADIVVFSRDEWDRMESSSSSAAAYVPPPAVIEVVSTNWRDDYIAKLDEYEALGILEFWAVDYAGLGGVRFIGSPKQPTLTIYALINGEYEPKPFRGDEKIVSQIFPALPLTAAQVFNMAKS
jgi:Uma2 family endonuclease